MKMQDFTRADLGNFYSWPLELLLKLGADLSVKDLTDLSGVNKAFQKIFTDNAFWENKFKIHYHRLYSKYQNQSVKSWYLLFKDTYRAEKKQTESRMKRLLAVRRGDPATLMKVLLAVREGDLETLKKIENLERILLIKPFHDLNGWDIFQNAYLKNSAILDYFNSVIENAEPDHKDSKYYQSEYSIWQIHLFKLAIACQRSEDIIDAKLQILQNELFANLYVNDIFKIILSEGKYVSLLAIAVRYRNKGAINYLLQKEAKVALVDLVAAVKIGDLDIFNSLLEKSFWKEKLSIHDLNYLLGIAVSKNQLNFVQKFIAMGGKVDMVDKENRTPLYRAIEENVNPEIIQYLLKLKKIDVKKHNKDNKTILHACATSGNYQLFKIFLPMIGKDDEILSQVAFAAFETKQYGFLINFLEEFKINPYEMKYRIFKSSYTKNLLDKLCFQRQLNNDEKKIANILVDNGAQPLIREPLKEIITIPNTFITPEHLQIIYKKEIARLKAYIAKRSGDTREYYFTFFGKKFGFSGTDKIIAAQALLNLLMTGDPKNVSELNLEQWAALHQGTLGKIYRSVRVSCKIDEGFYAVLRPQINVKLNGLLENNDAPGR